MDALDSNANEKILELKDLRVYFFTQDGVVKAVNNLNYYVKKGESVGLVGESGCGKSVSAFSILQLVPYPPGVIVGGQIIFQGQDLLLARENQMRQVRGNKIAMIYQEPTTSLNPVLPVGRQITELIELHLGLSRKEAEGKAIELLGAVGIPDAKRRLKNFPHQFSGGMQQRIIIAMALSCDPDLIIADEPTTAVDVTVQAQLMALISDLKRKINTSIVIITHNLGVIARYVDRVYVMYAGRIVETAPTSILFSKPRHPYTKGLLDSVPRLDKAREMELKPIPGQPPNLAHLPSGCAFEPRCQYSIEMCRNIVPELKAINENQSFACIVDPFAFKE
jgi:oligopeptide transport system ATP-binding protein